MQDMDRSVDFGELMIKSRDSMGNFVTENVVEKIVKGG